MPSFPHPSTQADRSEPYRLLDFLGSPPLRVPERTCRGCVMNEFEPWFSSLLTPVYDDGTITVRQDAEWPVPGFMVVAVRPHLGALDEMDLATAHRLATVTRCVRRAMRTELGLTAVQTYQEDKIERAHYHVWMLPLWPDVMEYHSINPRIYESNIAEYLRLFRLPEREPHIRFCTERIGDHLARSPELYKPSARPAEPACRQRQPKEYPCVSPR